MNGFEALEKKYTTYYAPKNTTTKQNRDRKRRNKIQTTLLDPKIWITLLFLFAFLLGLGLGTVGGCENV
jgi:hypothetical protein